jgi:serine/threonine protein kinase
MVSPVELGYVLASLNVLPGEQWTAAERQGRNIPDILGILRQERAVWDRTQPALTVWQCDIISRRVASERVRDLERDLRVNDYLILSHLGSGGMAQVHKAWSLATKEYVAIKRIITASSQEARDRLEREAEILRLLKDPRITRCVAFERSEDGNDGFLVMEYLDGQTLRDKLKDVKKLPVDQAVRYATEILQALVYLSRCGVVHRDIKPGNIMLLKSGEVSLKLMDFGLGKVIGPGAKNIPSLEAHGELTQMNVALGTAAYMPPEQFHDVRSVSFAADLYSAGICFFEMLAGHPPFEKTQFVALMLQHFHAKPPDIRTLCTELPEAVALAVDLMLEKDSEARKDARAICELLQNLDADTTKSGAAELPRVEFSDPVKAAPSERQPSPVLPDLSKIPELYHPARLWRNRFFRPSVFAEASLIIDPIPGPADIVMGLRNALWYMVLLLLVFGILRVVFLRLM